MAAVPDGHEAGAVPLRHGEGFVHRAVRGDDADGVVRVEKTGGVAPPVEFHVGPVVQHAVFEADHEKTQACRTVAADASQVGTHQDPGHQPGVMLWDILAAEYGIDEFFDNFRGKTHGAFGKWAGLNHEYLLKNFIFWVFHFSVTWRTCYILARPGVFREVAPKRAAPCGFRPTIVKMRFFPKKCPLKGER